MSYILHDWRPEDKNFWQQTGRKIAKRNLWISIPPCFWPLPCGRCGAWRWSICPISALNTAKTSFLAGGAARFIGRHFAHFLFVYGAGVRRPPLDRYSTASLLPPAAGLGFAAQNPDTSYITMMILALCAALAAATSHQAWPTSAFSFRKRKKARRWA